MKDSIIFNKNKQEIILSKEKNSLDKFVISFTKIMEKHFDYVYVSGYVSLLFGRSRATEDVDVLVEKITFEKFEGFFREMEKKGFMFLNSDDPKELFFNYLMKETAIRACKGKEYIPNIEIKFIKSREDAEAIKNKLIVRFDGIKLFIPEIEEQIAFKLWLGSDKDKEDAFYLYELFKKELNKEKLDYYCRRLNVKNIQAKLLK